MRFNSLLFIAFALFSTILALPFAEPRDDSLWVAFLQDMSRVV